MIKKLLDLKKRQTDQKMAQRAKIQDEIDTLTSEIENTQHKINTTSVDRQGAISDFSVLQMHKDTMNAHIVKLNNQKYRLEKQEKKVQEELKELLKESEQFEYLAKEQKKLELVKLIKTDAQTTEEFVQSQYIQNGF